MKILIYTNASNYVLPLTRARARGAPIPLASAISLWIKYNLVYNNNIKHFHLGNKFSFSYVCESMNAITSVQSK